MKKIIFFFLLCLSGLNLVNAQVYTENFNSTVPSNLPSGWTAVGGEWQTDPNLLNGGNIPACTVGGSSTGNVLYNFDGSTSTEEAITAPFATTGFSGMNLTFNAIKFDASTPQMTLSISSDNFATSTVLAFTDVPPTDTWGTISVAIPIAFENLPNVKLKFASNGTSSGSYYAIDDISITGSSSPNFYYNGLGPVDMLTSWGTNTDGSGSNPANFTANSQQFFLQNTASVNFNNMTGTSWTISGTGSKLVIGTGTSAINVTIPTTHTLFTAGTASIQVNNLATLVVQNTSYPNTRLSYQSGSTVEYAQSGAWSFPNTTYHNLTLSGGGIKQSSGSFIINGIFNLNGSSYQMNTAPSNSITLNGTIAGASQILTGNSCIVIGGTGAFGTLNFGNGSTSGLINKITMNRAGLGLVTVGSSFTITSNTVLNSGILNLNGNRLTLNGNVTFPSSVSNGAIRGSNTSSLTIGGSGSITNGLLLDQTSATTRAMNEIILNRSSASLTFGNAIEAWGSITPTVGTINTGGVLTLKADASNKGRIGQIGALGTLSGNVSVEVFKPAGATGWVNLCSGGVNGNNMNSWNSSFAITCSVCPDGWDVGGVNFTSIYEYDETTATGNSADPLHYIELGVAPASKAIDSKTGYWVYLGNGFPNTSAITIPLTGGVNTKNSSGNINLTLTGGAGPENGWNLVANPFPSPIVANQITGANFNASNMIAYDPDTDSNIPFSGTAVIPTGQAFMVQATAGGANLTPAESWKSAIADNSSILRTSAASNFYFDDFLINVTSNIVPTNFFTQAYFTFGNGNTNGYETSDCPSMPGQLATTPRFYSKFNGMDLLRNALPSLTGTISIPLLMHTGYAGAYTFNPVNVSKLPAGACVTLVDLVNNVSHNLRTGAYTTNIAANATFAQFELRIVVNNANLTSSFLNPTCKKLANASITAQGSGTGPFNYVWKDASSNIIQTNNNITGANTLNNIYAGVYIVDITKNNTCQNARATFTLNSTTPLPVANFTANSTTVFAGNNVPVSFSNLSANATGYEWNFNDGSNLVNTANASHVFADEGNYTVVLKANNGACLDTAIYTSDIYVQAAPVGIKDKVANNSNYFISKDEDGMFVKFNYSTYSEVMFDVTNILGQVLIPTQILNVSESKHYFNVPENEKLIFVTITENGVRKTSKVIAK